MAERVLRVTGESDDLLEAQTVSESVKPASDCVAQNSLTRQQGVTHSYFS